MPNYRSLGTIPEKRHTVFKNAEGSLYHEELVGTQGFSSLSSLVYHHHAPTQVVEMNEAYSVKPEIAIENNLKMLSLRSFDIPSSADYIESRKVLFINNDVQIGIAAPTVANNYFFKNTDGDELMFFHKGSGVFKSMYGEIPFEPGDYLLIPKGTVYTLDFSSAENRILFVQSSTPIHTPRRYRNDFGQLLEHSPFCERDFKYPQNLKSYNEKGRFEIRIKKKDEIFTYYYANHPFDVIGWDGFLYPFAFNIRNFEPITGRIHMPPPIHQTFEGRDFVVCSFVPRLYDYHPDAIPAPYHHSNVDSDEILYYVEGNFMSRKDVTAGQLTLHPAGLTHGPHPGAIEKSIGKTRTDELAVMIDPFAPVSITQTALDYSLTDYWKTWVEA
jgi:homogentisate 1,2-dioxygenase